MRKAVITAGVPAVDGKNLQEHVRNIRASSGRREASFTRLDDESAFCVLGAAAFMARFAKMHGSKQQRLFIRLLDAGVRSETDLRSWLEQSFSPVNARRWDSARKRSQRLLEAGIQVFRPAAPLLAHPADRTDAPQCPGVLFGKGCPPHLPPLLAVFNSRKPRLLSPDSTWLDVLRRFLRAVDHEGIGLVGSIGTLTYDLASVLAQHLGFLKLIVAPFPLIAAERQLLNIFGEEASGFPVISCMFDGAACPAKLPMRCRDRFLAALADFHLVLEIRSRGNLLATLRPMQSTSPRPQFVLKPDILSPSNAGNFTLLKDFPEHSIGFEFQRPMGPAETSPAAPADPFRSSHSVARLTPTGTIPWQDYLFHYTRACSGPWPGESYRQYLLGLLDARPLPGRSALDVLVRIAQEALLLASCRMIRGRTPVVCWSSIPPRELFRIRKWRRALVRWTVEPYGVAVRRDLLRALGAKPAIYANAQVYAMLADSEKYRFQMSRSGRSASWRHEREWRSAGDLALREIKPDQGFFFVQTPQEAVTFYRLTYPGLPVIAVNESDC